MSVKMSARLIGLLIALIFCLSMVYLMTIGMKLGEGVSEGTYYQDGAPAMGDHVSYTTYGPYYPAIFPFTLVLMIGLGLANDRVIGVAWAGILIAIPIGFILIFGLGMFIWGIAALLLVPLSVIQWQISSKRGWLAVGMAAALFLIWCGVGLYGGGIYGGIALAAGVISALLLAGLFLQSHQQHTAIS